MNIVINKSGRGLVAVIVILALAIVAVGGGIYMFAGCSGNGGGAEEAIPINPITGEELNGQELPPRPIMVSIDNVGDAIPQSHISNADIVYEMPVEGRQTRLEPIYYSDIPEFFGPVRSARPYIVNQAQEYGAIFIAYGWNATAKRYLTEYGFVPYINGMENSELFYRVSDKPGPHNAYIAYEDIENKIEEGGEWWTEKQDIRPFSFRDDEWRAERDKMKTAAENGETITDDEGNEIEYKEPEKADEITFKYMSGGCEFSYDAETGEYARFKYGSPYVDKETGEQITVKNVIVQYVHSEVYDTKGRLKINLKAGGKALLFTEGEVIKGTWSRKGMKKRTIFKDEDGNEFRLAVGKSWVEVMDQSCTFSYK